MSSRYYADDPHVHVLDEYAGIRPGDRVRYVGPMPMPGEFVVDEIIRIDEGFNDEAPLLTAILDRGELEVDPRNLRKVET